MKRFLLITLFAASLSVTCIGQVRMAGWTEKHDESLDRYAVVKVENTGNKDATTFEFTVFAYRTTMEIFPDDTFTRVVQASVPAHTTKYITVWLPDDKYGNLRMALTTVRFKDGSVIHPN